MIFCSWYFYYYFFAPPQLEQAFVVTLIGISSSPRQLSNVFTVENSSLCHVAAAAASYPLLSLSLTLSICAQHQHSFRSFGKCFNLKAMKCRREVDERKKNRIRLILSARAILTFQFRFSHVCRTISLKKNTDEAKAELFREKEMAKNQMNWISNFNLMPSAHIHTEECKRERKATLLDLLHLYLCKNSSDFRVQWGKMKSHFNARDWKRDEPDDSVRVLEREQHKPELNGI